MNATCTAVREARTIAGPAPCTDNNRVMGLLVNDPTSLLVLGRRLAMRRLDALQQLPLPRPRGTAGTAPR